MKEIRIRCCEGCEAYEGECMRSRCPEYKQASYQVNRSWPYMATGFGNAYGYPRHGDYLERVRLNIREENSEVAYDSRDNQEQ